MLAALRWSTSIPTTRNPASASPTASGSPTYPIPITPTRAVRFSIFSASLFLFHAMGTPVKRSAPIYAETGSEFNRNCNRAPWRAPLDAFGRGA